MQCKQAPSGRQSGAARSSLLCHSRCVALGPLATPSRGGMGDARCQLVHIGPGAALPKPYRVGPVTLIKSANASCRRSMWIRSRNRWQPKGPIHYARKAPRCTAFQANSRSWPIRVSVGECCPSKWLDRLPVRRPPVGGEQRSRTHVLSISLASDLWAPDALER